MSLAYEPLNNILDAASEARVKAAARGLLNAVAVREACVSLGKLYACGVIDEPMAAELALELNDQMVQDRDNGQQVVGPAPAVELPAPSKAEPEPAAEKPKKHKRPGQLGVSRFCPICEEEGERTRLSPGSVGCVKHWREVKRRSRSKEVR